MCLSRFGIREHKSEFDTDRRLSSSRRHPVQSYQTEILTSIFYLELSVEGRLTAMEMDFRKRGGGRSHVLEPGSLLRA